ncbi:MAG: hypothetical protein WC285_06230 [Candidatus Gracilibacteria bacterium]|jgi:hypothetical protein
MDENKVDTNKKEEDRPSNQVDLSVTFEDFKRSLGKAAGKYTDEQIERMRTACDKMADLVFDTWLNKRNTA